jgi:hypothetical protein
MKLLEELPKLTKQELRAVQLAVENLLLADAKLNKYLFQAILRRSGFSISEAKFQHMTTTYKTWVKNQQAVEELINKINPSNNFVLNIAAENGFADWLWEYMEYNNIPISLRSIADALAHAEEIFEHNFPGYLQSGTASMVIRTGS